MSDLISRQAAIDALRDWEMCYDWDEHCREEPKAPWVVSPSGVINKLPPAELSTNLAEVGTDAISRKQAVDALRKMQTYKLFSGDDMLLIDQAGAQTELMLLPSAQLEGDAE